MSNNLNTHPLQSSYWGDFRKQWGNIIERINIDGKDIQIIFSKIPRTPFTIGNVLKGPEPTDKNIRALKELGKKYNSLFIKLEPNIETNNKVLELLKKYTVPGKRFFTPTTFILDLTKNEDEMLSSFTPKTRYNIRLAQKHNVEVAEDNSDMAFNEYLKLTGETTKRQNFFAHNRKYHQLMWKYLHTDMVNKKIPPIAHLLTASYNKEIITTWILFAWNKTLYYPYGASSQKHKNVMANNLMMWEAIKLGKKLGCTSFDLWGRELGKGFTKFKEGYNPKVVEFVGSWDIVTSPLYYPYRVIEYIRWFAMKGISIVNIKKPHF